jgi:hypothetical protein
MPATSASRPRSGTPRLRRIGAWTATRPADGARGRALAGAGRPLDGGRGRTWVGREPRRVVIGPDCRTARRAAGRGGVLRDRRPPEGRHVGARRCVVLWRGRARRRSVALAARGEACRPAIHEPVDRSPARARVPTAGRPPPAEVRRPDRPSDGRDSVSGRSRGSRPRRSPHVRRRRRCRHSRARASDCRISVGTSAPTST